MPLNWTTGALMRPAGCLPCCGGAPTPPVTCDCDYYFYDFNNPPGPGGDPNPFGNVAGAQAWIDNYTANCSLAASRNNSVFSGVNIAVSQIDLSMNTAFVTPGLNVAYTDVLFAFSAAAGTTVNFSVQNFSSDGNTATNYAVTFGLVDCNNAAINPDSGDPNYSVFTVPDVNPIIATMSIFGYENSTYANAGLRIDPNANFYLSPAIALWDDSGTTRKLWACPKLYLPIYFPGPLPGIWYPSLVVAQSEIARTVYSCIGIGTGRDYPGTYYASAIDGGTSLQLIASQDNYCGGSGPGTAMFGSVNLVAGDTLSVAWSSALSGGAIDISSTYTLYRLKEDGTYESIDTQNSTIPSGTSDSGTFTFPITITGNYVVGFSVFGVGGATTTEASMDATFTSSGTLSVNPVQAMWDAGLDCPGLWDCTGSEVSDGSWTPGGGSCGPA